MTSRPDQRHRALRRGQTAEIAAAMLLQVKFYRILARRWRPLRRVPGAGEIDIIARRGRVLAFIEVKARDDDSAAGDAITAQQRQRIAKSATIFVQQNPHHAGCDIRFDAILVRRQFWPRHIAGAWHTDA